MWLTWLADAARETGYPVIEDSGWPGRGNKDKTRPDGSMSRCEGVVGHHTGTPNTAVGDYPTRNIIRTGRTGLVGLLAHLGIGRSGSVYVMGAGHAYHAGVSAYAGFQSLNDKFVGIEAESAGDGRWTDKQLDCYPKLVAAVLRHAGKPADRYASHRMVALPAGRKTDPVGIADNWMREQVAAILRGSVVPAGTPWLALPSLKFSDEGPGVMSLQKWLVKMFPSYAKFTPTGLYGPQTQMTIAEFQKRSGIIGADADGSLIGPRTKKALWDQGFRG